MDNEIQRIDTGSEQWNQLLNGGYETDCITTLYGPAAAGKSTACLLAMAKVVESGKIAFYIDSEGGFSVDRLRQVAPDIDLSKVIVLRPKDFREQGEFLKNLPVNKSTGIFVVDTISMYYRIESEKRGRKALNKELSVQISYLLDIVRQHRIPVLIVSQVYADFDQPNQVKLIGGDLLKVMSKCIIEIQNFKNQRKAIIKKHRSIEEGKEVMFTIVQYGFE